MQHEPPPITIRDPARLTTQGDVLDDEPRRRAWLPAAALVLALLLIGANAVTGERDRDERRQQNAIVALSLAGRAGFTEARGAAVTPRSARVALEVELRNDGPLEVRVERAEVGGFRFLGALRLAPGQTAALPLDRTATCAPGGGLPRLDERPEGLTLQVDTLSGVREVVLQPDPASLDRLATSTRRACGFLPVEESFRSDSGPVTLLAGGFLAPLQIANSSVRPLRLTAVQVVPGLAVELRTQRGDRVTLPAYLAPGQFGQPPEVTRYQLRGSVQCDRLDADAQRDLSRVVVNVDDGLRGPATSRTSLLGSTESLRQLVGRVCGVALYGSRAS